jgi:hypothetical protein
VAETDRERLAGVTGFVSHLIASHPPPVERDTSAMAEEVWLLTAPEVYRLCTAVRGWSADRYEEWLRRMLTAVLLPPAPPG